MGCMPRRLPRCGTRTSGARMHLAAAQAASHLAGFTCGLASIGAGPSGCVVPGEGAQEHHVALCLVAYLVVERERLNCGDTWRQRERQLILRGGQAVLPALERVRSAA